ncbi:LysR family transcriptional regulator [Salipiger marinus]|jgi:DNA-binding transcriptional LysR family regulator|uniref:Transcriptional regulator, LysR family n=1 Tax=Salipiger marinus TaxID=555512 RepID=A0A1G8HV72_9RHOB|nr:MULTISPECIES: LysR family transcriptional regulator [Salipiger]MCD1616966.1 LysR family transcriptional regulator [Salipiger manganoxidans]MEB3417000.1 LysR family transcriptional regulator [Salipiger manganoxidans]SDI10559.1 transcriptional regulator, LysR family [Salipiger marinus]
MENWDEIRTAYHVARLGTVSGAAEVLGVHHATVIRHIDALEARLGVKLFQRHARGYTPTEAGQDLARVAQTTDDQFHQLTGRIKGRGEAVSGELLVTSLTNFAPLIVGALVSFRALYPDVTARFLTGERLFRLEYGEAHVALRAGAAPQEPDNVVQPFSRQAVALYAAASYVEARGLPKGPEEFGTHDFVGFDDLDSRAPSARWMKVNVPAARVVFRTSDDRVQHQAVRAGAGMGFMPVTEAEGDAGLVQVMPPQEDWSAPLWLVTHVDLHRTPKVQAFVKHLKAYAGEKA